MKHEAQPPASPVFVGSSRLDIPQTAASQPGLENGVPTKLLAPAMSHGVSYGTEFDHDFLERFHMPVPAVASSLGDLVSDAGYSLEPFDKSEDIHYEQSSDLVGFGTQFDSGNEERPNSAIAIEDLEAWIREKREDSAEPRSPFLPVDQLERCMTWRNVQRHLHQAGIDEELEHYTAALLQLGKNSRQRIFAILCMIELSAQIVEFIHAGIYDTDLPFKLKNDMVFRDAPKDSGLDGEPLLTLRPELWKPMHCEFFENYQGQLSPPILKLSWTATEKVLHFSLKDQVVLPFMEMKDTSKGDELETTIQREGGTSVVRKVKIHHAHYNAPSSTTLKNNTYFAVKELKTGYKADREAVALKRFHDKRHPHLIRLLATYTYRGHFNLLFPWADGNLKEFWKVVQPPALEAFQQAAVARWMSAQILGLAQALEVIHYCEIDKANVHNFTADQIGKTHGRHGDLKPENILWFNENESGQQKTGEDPMGVLQIGDLGLADFHSKHSKSIVPPSAVDGVTETYSAPELYVAQRVSPQFDIWSFGCILLQFVVWYIHGWTGIDEFAEARIRESKGFIFPLDNFYSLDADGTHAYVKNSVAKMFDSLKNADICSDYILDLLEYVEGYLLRVDSAKRARVEFIVKHFEALAKDCRQIPHYCTQRTKEAKQPDSGLRETVKLQEISEKSLTEPSLTKSLPAPNGDVHSGSLTTTKHTHISSEQETSNSIIANGSVDSLMGLILNGMVVPDVTARIMEDGRRPVYHSESATNGNAEVDDLADDIYSPSGHTSRRKPYKASNASMSALSLPSIFAISSAANDSITPLPSTAASHLQDSLGTSDSGESPSRNQMPSQTQTESNAESSDVEPHASSAAKLELVITRTPPHPVARPLGSSQTQGQNRPTHSGTVQPDASGFRAPEQPRGFRQRSRKLLSRVADRLCLV